MVDSQSPAQVSDPSEVPPEVVHFFETVPEFSVLEFISFPEAQLTPEEWLEMQADFLERDPGTTTLRVLTPLPNGLIVVFDLTAREQGFPLSTSDPGFPEDAEPMGVTLDQYRQLALDLAPLEQQMLEGTYPHDAIVATYVRHGLSETEYWSEVLAQLEEGRDDTERRMQYVREQG